VIIFRFLFYCIIFWSPQCQFDLPPVRGRFERATLRVGIRCEIWISQYQSSIDHKTISCSNGKSIYKRSRN